MSMQVETALEEILACAGTQFDPEIAQLFAHTYRESFLA